MAKYFELPVEMVENHLKQKILNKEIDGYVQENTFYRDWPDFLKHISKEFDKKLVMCKSCSNKTPEDKPFCHWCGYKRNEEIKGKK